MNVHICRLTDYGCTYARIVTFVPTIPQYLIAAQSFMCEISKKQNIYKLKRTNKWKINMFLCLFAQRYLMLKVI